MKISIIIPTRNRIERLKRAVNSITYQGIEHVEVIIVDDSDEDSTDAIRREFNQLEFVNVFRSGLFSAAKTRNYGVSKASAEYITFLDDDDVYMPGRLSSMLNHELFNLDNKFSFFSSGRFKEENDFQTIRFVDNQRYGIVTLEDNLLGNDIDIGFIMKKELFLSLGGFDESFSSFEDWEFILRALQVNNGYKIERLDYAVNVDLDRDRVSLSQHESLYKLAEKHKNNFGVNWFYKIKLQGLYGNRELTLFKTIKLCFCMRSLFPVLTYIRTIGRYIVRTIIN